MLKVVTVKNEVFNRIGVHLLKVVFASLSLVILIENLSFSESVKSLFLPHSLKWLDFFSLSSNQLLPYMVYIICTVIEKFLLCVWCLS